ncbi:integrase, partial [Bacillus spizizenii]|nr:integrase [Bacillus spizizenii]
YISKNSAAKLKELKLGKRIPVHGKGDKEREVNFNTRCSIWLKRYLDERDDEETGLFTTERRPKGV